jgi:hypothetical protein
MLNSKSSIKETGWEKTAAWKTGRANMGHRQDFTGRQFQAVVGKP